MGFLDAINTKQRRGRNESYSSVYRNIGSSYGYYRRSNYQGYESIVREVYLTNHIVNRALEEKIKAMNKIDFCVYRRTKDGDEVIKNHPIEVLLKEPNGYYGGDELVKRMTLFYYFVGESPFELVKNTFRSRLYVHRPDRIYYTPTGNEEYPYKDVQYTGSVNANLRIEDFMLYKNFNPVDDIEGLGRGLSPLISIFKQIDQLNSIDEWKLSLTENGGSLSGVISVDEMLDDDVYERSKKELKQNHQGAKNVGKFLFLEGGAKFSATSNTPRDMDYIDGEKLIIQNLCSGVGIDPLLIGYKDYSTYNNLQEASKDMYNKDVIPFLGKFCSFFTTEFTKRGMLEKDEYVGLNTDNVLELQKDKKILVERLRNSDFMTINEKRKELGLPETDGGDVVLVPMNLIPLNQEPEVINEGKSLFIDRTEGSWY